MNIVSLLDSLLTSVFDAEKHFFDNPRDFISLERSVKSSTESFAVGFLGAILSEMDQAIKSSSWREGRYTVQRKDSRTLISSVGDITFDCTYYKSKNKETGFTHLLEDLIGLDKNERFAEVAEAAILSEALKTSYAEATKILPSKQEITSQLPVIKWWDLFKDNTYAEACLSRMTSKAYRLECNGRDMRKS